MAPSFVEKAFGYPVKCEIQHPNTNGSMKNMDQRAHCWELCHHLDVWGETNGSLYFIGEPLMLSYSAFRDVMTNSCFVLWKMI